VSCFRVSIFMMKRFTNINALLDNLSEGVFLFDAHGNIVFWNKAASAILGFPKEEMIGLSVFIVFRGWTFPWERDAETAAYPVSESGEIVAVENRAGREMMLAMEASPQHDEAGEIAGGIGIFHDVSLKLEEMALAQRIQSEIINKQPSGTCFTLDVYFHPDGIIGGDYFKMHELSGHEYSLFVGDFTGHGLVGAMYTVMIDKHLVELKKKLADPQSLAQQLNDDLGKLLAPGYFCTAVVGLLNTKEMSFTFVQAGNPPMLHILNDGTIEAHESTSPPLGMFDEAQFALSRIKLKPGESLFFFSDGVVEAPNADGKMIGLQGLRHVLQSVTSAEKEWCTQDIIREVKLRFPAFKMRDDVLLVKLSLIS
jgi:PAS domain S-box-containing protein